MSQKKLYKTLTLSLVTGTGCTSAAFAYRYSLRHTLTKELQDEHGELSKEVMRLANELTTHEKELNSKRHSINERAEIIRNLWDDRNSRYRDALYECESYSKALPEGFAVLTGLENHFEHMYKAAPRVVEYLSWALKLHHYLLLVDQLRAVSPNSATASNLNSDLKDLLPNEPLVQMVCDDNVRRHEHFRQTSGGDLVMIPNDFDELSATFRVVAQDLQKAFAMQGEEETVLRRAVAGSARTLNNKSDLLCDILDHHHDDDEEHDKRVRSLFADAANYLLEIVKVRTSGLDPVARNTFIDPKLAVTSTTNKSKSNDRQEGQQKRYEQQQLQVEHYLTTLPSRYLYSDGSCTQNLLDPNDVRAAASHVSSVVDLLQAKKQGNAGLRSQARRGETQTKTTSPEEDEQRQQQRVTTAGNSSSTDKFVMEAVAQADSWNSAAKAFLVSRQNREALEAFGECLQYTLLKNGSNSDKNGDKKQA